MRANDLSGLRFGRLVAVERDGTYTAPNGRKTARWLCKCDCGQTISCISTSLRNGHTKSCGCLMRERSAAAATKHGGEGTRLYDVWINMKQRCENTNNPRYHDYGGRGITVCSEWHDYAEFAEWAAATGYDERAARGKCTLDRINNDKGYAPDNCRWTDMREQRVNQRRNTNGFQS